MPTGLSHFTPGSRCGRGSSRAIPSRTHRSRYLVPVRVGRHSSSSPSRATHRKVVLVEAGEEVIVLAVEALSTDRPYRSGIGRSPSGWHRVEDRVQCREPAL